MKREMPDEMPNVFDENHEELLKEFRRDEAEDHFRMSGEEPDARYYRALVDWGMLVWDPPELWKPARYWPEDRRDTGADHNPGYSGSEFSDEP